MMKSVPQILLEWLRSIGSVIEKKREKNRKLPNKQTLYYQGRPSSGSGCRYNPTFSALPLEQDWGPNQSPTDSRQGYLIKQQKFDFAKIIIIFKFLLYKLPLVPQAPPSLIPQKPGRSVCLIALFWKVQDLPFRPRNSQPPYFLIKKTLYFDYDTITNVFAKIFCCTIYTIASKRHHLDLPIWCVPTN